MHKVSSQSESTSFNQFTPESSIHTYHTRISTRANYYVNRTNSKQGCKSKLILGPKIWAEVPSEIKEFSLKTFTKKYKQYLLTKYD